MPTRPFALFASRDARPVGALIFFFFLLGISASLPRCSSAPPEAPRVPRRGFKAGRDHAAGRGE